MRKITLYIIIAYIFAVCVALLCIFIPRPSQRLSVYFHADGVIRDMPLEEYIMHVVAAEMPSSFESEALRAQAVAVRTYTLRKADSNQTDSHHMGADICTDSSHCQAYGDAIHQKHRDAVTDTEGIVMTVGGELINAVYHAAAHGYTENAADVWGGALPYLTSVESYGDSLCPYYIDEKTFTAAELRQLLNIPSDPPLIGEIIRSGAGGVMRITLAGQEFSGTHVRSALGLQSTCFVITQEGDGYTFRTEGYGHGVGMSQWGANAMAKDGADYVKILRHYYTGANVDCFCIN